MVLAPPRTVRLLPLAFWSWWRCAGGLHLGDVASSPQSAVSTAPTQPAAASRPFPALTAEARQGATSGAAPKRPSSTAPAQSAAAAEPLHTFPATAGVLPTRSPSLPSLARPAYGAAERRNATSGVAPRRSPRTPEEAAADYGGVQGLCGHWGWQPLRPGARRPRIHYGTIAGNGGQSDLYEMHFLEVSPFVERIVAIDPKMTQLGHPRNASLDMSLPGFRRFGDQLRRVELENPITNGKLVSDLSEEEFDALKRPGKDQPYRWLVIEQWQRAQMERGFKDSHGEWEMDENDIVVVTDSDEIPLPHFLAALQYCEVPSFESVKRKLDGGLPLPGKFACQGSTLAMRSQVYEYFVDCPTRKPTWLHPNVALARCLMNGVIDFEDVRSGLSFRGQMPNSVAGRHLHNVGMSLQDIVFKYGHYAEPRVHGIDSGLSIFTNEEMMWRGCDPKAPDIGPDSWYMRVRPSNDFLRTDSGRGMCPLMYSREEHRGLDIPFAILEERPELTDQLYWRGHAELRNPFTGKSGGSNYFNK